jgi:glycosyltransferase involved in cell wall biosynthesis
VSRPARRITIVTAELRGFRPVGGAGTATTFLALALARMGHAVEVLLALHHNDSIDPYWADVYRRAGVALRPAPVSDERVEPQHFELIRNVELGLRADPPDVAIVHDFGALTYSALQLRQATVAFEDTLFVIFCHGTGRYLLDVSSEVSVKNVRHLLEMNVLERASAELADVVVSPSAYLAGWMRDQGWQLPERTLVIPYFTWSSATGEPVSMQDHRGEEHELRRVAFFGRLSERKGLKVFAEGLNAVEPKLLDGIELEFVGKTTANWSRNRVEALLSDRTARALAKISYETDLDQHEALARMSTPGTLAVMPSPQENSPNTVYECLEHAIPFISSEVGGVPELIAREDHARVLFKPTARGVEDALTRVLTGARAIRPARPAFASGAAYDGWSEVVGIQPRPRGHTVRGRVDVVVVNRQSSEALRHCLAALERQSYKDVNVILVERSSVEAARLAGLRAGRAPYVVFLDEDDAPDDKFVETLLRAQLASGADVVTCATHIGSDDTLHLFAGEPEALGLLSNAYGAVALFRRETLADAAIADWPLLAGLSLAGAKIVSVPVALVTRRERPAAVETDSAQALLVVRKHEGVLPDALRSLARLAAGIAARPQAPAADPRPGLLHRTVYVLRNEGMTMFVRRSFRRILRP